MPPQASDSLCRFSMYCEVMQTLRSLVVNSQVLSDVGEVELDRTPYVVPVRLEDGPEA